MIQFDYPYGATLLDTDECDGLIPQHITTQAELNEWEETNILDAENWLSKRRYHSNEILGVLFIKKLHQKMFNATWKWAGQFRQTNKNIGPDWPLIQEQIKTLIDDIQYQIPHKTYENDEIAARFHHRLVSIHPFSNGNGRHSRLMTDLLLITINQPRFSWGRNSQLESIEIRKRYINALKTADQKDYQSLLNFVRS